jgi:hypothetical protein
LAAAAKLLRKKGTRSHTEDLGVTVVRVDKSKGRWEAIPVQLIEDKRLSRGAVGTAVWLLARRDGFVVLMSSLPRLLSSSVERVGRDKCRGWVRELEEAGYVQRHRQRHTDGRWTWEFVLSALPTTIDGFSVDGRAVNGPAADGDAVDKQQTRTTSRLRLHQTTTTAEQQPVVVVGLDQPPLADHEASIRKYLAVCPVDLRQQVVDQAAGIAMAGRVRSNVAALIRKLSIDAAAGDFEPGAGVAVASARLRAQLGREQKATEDEERRRRDTPEARAASKVAAANALAKMAALRMRSAPSSSVVADRPASGGDR